MVLDRLLVLSEPARDASSTSLPATAAVITPTRPESNGLPVSTAIPCRVPATARPLLRARILDALISEYRFAV
ncbi:hypothetical protein [Streptomyces sp. NPDC001070]